MISRSIKQISGTREAWKIKGYVSPISQIRKLNLNKVREFAQRFIAIELRLEPGFLRSLVHPDTYILGSVAFPGMLF